MTTDDARAYLRLGYCHPAKLAEGCERCAKRTAAMRALIAEGVRKTVNECVGRAIASPSLMDAIDLIGQADERAEAIARELAP